MVAQITPGYYEAHEMEFQEEQAQRRDMARAAAEEEARGERYYRMSPAEFTAAVNQTLANLDAIEARLAAIEAEGVRERARIIQRGEEKRQKFAESFEDYLSRKADEQAEEDEARFGPAPDYDPSDEQLCRVR